MLGRGGKRVWDSVGSFLGVFCEGFGIAWCFFGLGFGWERVTNHILLLHESWLLLKDYNHCLYYLRSLDLR